nr:DUF2213 domain-containing protein [Roseomonas haemaphysalidis]
MPASPGRTAEGWIRDEPILTRAGIFEYRMPDGRMRKEFRPAAEVFKATSMAGLKGIPVTNGHPALVTSKSPAGIIGTVLSAGRQDGNNLRAELVIHDPDRIGSNRDISLGYRVQLVNEPGTYEGERYDAVQTAITYNHCAIVPKGRAGNSRLTFDGAGVMVLDGLPTIHPTSGAVAAREKMIQRSRNGGGW